MHHIYIDAFLFVLKSDINQQKPEIFNLIPAKSNNAIYNYFDIAYHAYLFHFGSAAGLAICTNFDKPQKKCFCFGTDFYIHSYDLPKGNIMCGGNDCKRGSQYFFNVIDIEVFHIPN